MEINELDKDVINDRTLWRLLIVVIVFSQCAYKSKIPLTLLPRENRVLR